MIIASHPFTVSPQDYQFIFSIPSHQTVIDRVTISPSPSPLKASALNSALSLSLYHVCSSFLIITLNSIDPHVTLLTTGHQLDFYFSSQRSESSQFTAIFSIHFSTLHLSETAKLTMGDHVEALLKSGYPTTLHTRLSLVCPCLPCSREPKLETALQLWSHKGEIEGEDHSPEVAGCTLGNVTQYGVGLPHCNNISVVLYDFT